MLTDPVTSSFVPIGLQSPHPSQSACSDEQNEQEKTFGFPLAHGRVYTTAPLGAAFKQYARDGNEDGNSPVVLKVRDSFLQNNFSPKQRIEEYTFHLYPCDMSSFLHPMNIVVNNITAIYVQAWYMSCFTSLLTFETRRFAIETRRSLVNSDTLPDEINKFVSLDNFW